MDTLGFCLILCFHFLRVPPKSALSFPLVFLQASLGCVFSRVAFAPARKVYLGRSFVMRRSLRQSQMPLHERIPRRQRKTFFLAVPLATVDGRDPFRTSYMIRFTRNSQGRNVSHGFKVVRNGLSIHRVTEHLNTEKLSGTCAYGERSK